LCGLIRCKQEANTISKILLVPVEDADNLLLAGRATEMDITMIGLQNAGKTSLLRVLAVSIPSRA
jgi:GTPase SAR1 family protein